MKFIARLLCVVLLTGAGNLGAIEVNPGYPGSIDDGESESPLRRGEVIFFISYPFTFLASFAVYGLAGYGMRALEAGKQDFSPQGPFFGLVAVTAAILSFGIAMDDYYAVKAQARTIDGKPGAELSLTFRF
ncbi:MAG: hypothetical protein JNJ69_03850 [Leptospiraceae bacterium]|nr:hypothetical protein [Leptospiraceae bacterium]